MNSTLSLVIGGVEKVAQIVSMLIHDEDDVASFASIAAVGASFRNVCFAAKAHTAVSAVARFGKDFDVIDKHEIK